MKKSKEARGVASVSEHCGLQVDSDSVAMKDGRRVDDVSRRIGARSAADILGKDSSKGGRGGVFTVSEKDSVVKNES